MSAQISKKIKLGLFIFVILSSCKNDYDAKSAAGEYCKCMAANDAPKQYLYAATICDAELIKKNRYYRIDHIEFRYDKDSYSRYSQATIDSVKKFNLEFLGYIHEDCCQQTLFCK